MTRRIGDVLLTTPLLRTLRRAWPQAQIDVLVFAGTEGVLSGNPDINHVLVITQRVSFIVHLRFLARLWRRYNLAISVLPGDRPTLYAIVAGRMRIGMVIAEKKHWWKKLLLTQCVSFDRVATHTIRMILKPMELLSIQPSFDVTVSWREEDEAQLRRVLPFDPVLQDYAVLHVYPMYAYKMWRLEAWVELSKWLNERGLRIVLTGNKTENEIAYIRALLPSLPADTVSVAGNLSLGSVAFLLSHARAYVGPDTAITHMAAALGIPTVALFGPSNPVTWGPWPYGYAENRNPWRMHGTQKFNNVVLLQGVGSCVPCMEEGCARNVESLSDCLQNMPASVTIAALLEAWRGADKK